MAVYTVSISDGTTLSNLAVSAGRGPKGDGFTGGTYNASTGIVTFTSNDGIGFSTGDLRGDLSEPGPIGDVTPNTGAFTSLSAAQYNSTEALPDIKPSLNLDFANTKALDPRITYTRGSTATYYDGKTFAKAEENLLIRSQEFDNAIWNKSNITVTANSTTAPDGTTTADTLVENTSAGEHSVAGGEASITSGATYTISVFAKQGSGSRKLAFRGFGEGANYPIFNLTTGAVDNNGTNWSNQTITDVGNSWYRCSATVTAASTANPLFHLIDGSTLSYTGDGTSSIYLWGAQVEQRSALTDYTATTTQPITNYIPALQTAASGEARFDHDPITGESKGFLIEEQRTNLLTYSEQFDNASWTKSNSSITSNIVVAPDGTLTGDKLVEDTANSSHVAFQAVTLTTSTTYTFSAFAKKSDREFVRIGFTGNGKFNAVNFNFDTQVFSGLSTATGYSDTVFGYEDVGGGWFLLWFTTTMPSDVVPSAVSLGAADSSTSASYLGDGYSGIYLWGAQLEQASFPTSYIPTVASQVTRSIDAARMTGTNFSSWYRQDEGTVYTKASKDILPPGGVNASTVYTLSDGGITSNSIFNQRVSGGTSNQIQTFVFGSSQTVLSKGTNSTGDIAVANAYKEDDFAVSFDGETAITSSTNNVPRNVDQLDIGKRVGAGSYQLNGHIKKLAYYPKRLSNATLQALTEE